MIMTTTTRRCDLRLGDVITARAHIPGPYHMVAVEGVCVQVTPNFAGLMNTGYESAGNGTVRSGDGLLMVGKHTEIICIRAPQSAEELDEWFSRPVVLCGICN